MSDGKVTSRTQAVNEKKKKEKRKNKTKKKKEKKKKTINKESHEVQTGEWQQEKGRNWVKENTVRMDIIYREELIVLVGPV